MKLKLHHINLCTTNVPEMDRFYRYFLNLGDEDPTELYTQSQDKRKETNGVTRRHTFLKLSRSPLIIQKEGSFSFLSLNSANTIKWVGPF